MWVDLDEGPVFGRVITTDTRTANLIVAILAVVTAVGTAHLWNLTLFGFHQFRVSFTITDGLYRQQQAILRTLPTPSSLVADWAKLWWVWRNKTDRVLWRSLPQILIGAVFAAATVTAGIYTSVVVSNSDVQVLVDQSLSTPSICYGLPEIQIGLTLFKKLVDRTPRTAIRASTLRSCQMLAGLSSSPTFHCKKTVWNVHSVGTSAQRSIVPLSPSTQA
jgi:hypothetical protein